MFSRKNNDIQISIDGRKIEKYILVSLEREEKFETSSQRVYSVGLISKWEFGNPHESVAIIASGLALCVSHLDDAADEFGEEFRERILKESDEARKKLLSNIEIPEDTGLNGRD